MMNQLLTLSTVYLIWGNVNIDGIDAINCSRLRNVLHNYKMIVSEPTDLDGAALDHVYLLKTFLHNNNILCSVKNIYFSDHDTIYCEV